jgi:crotonobetainyl-CoA:carnitine CoA-transferase CaiB-like acyl-CoA transferase
MDSVIQALSGTMLVSGAPGDDPVRLGLPVGDLVAPLYALVGTMAALREAERSGTGQHVDVSMLGALTALVACEPFDAFEQLGLAQRTGNLVPRLAPFGIFPTSDGFVSISAPTDAFAAAALRALDLGALAADPRFATRDGRAALADELHARIASRTAELTTREAVDRLTAVGAPCAPVRTPAEALRDPLVRARGEVVPLTHPDLGEVEGLATTGVPIVFSASATGFSRPAPRVGEHNAAVFGELLGYSDARLAQLAADGVL